MKKKKEIHFKYRVDISWSEEDDCYIARVPELSGCVTDGETIEKAARNAKEAIELYLETLKDQKKTFPQALADRKFSGKLPLRISPELHKDLMARALSEDLSLNQYIEKNLKKAV